MGGFPADMQGEKEETMLETAIDALLDALKTLPFLLGAYLLMEFLEHRQAGKGPRLLQQLGPLGGAVLGCVPQCGFSVAAANLYAARYITPGTLLAVFLATSDEAVLILLSQPGALGEIAKLLGVKLLSAAAFGFLADGLLRCFFRGEARPDAHALCEEAHCGCEGQGILRPALRHTLRIFLFLLTVNLLLGFGLEALGEEALSRVMLSGSALQPFLTALIGFIPNCAASVLLTELYLGGAISFGAAAAGLCTGAGLGLLVLFRVNKPQRQNFLLAGALYGAAVTVGLILH